MAIVDIVQLTDKWFAWRKEGITASMIPVIMGLSPYQTPYQLWAELVGYKEPDDLSNNYHVQRGIAQEPEARDVVETQYGKPYMPCCVEADHNTLFKASLDGLFSFNNEKEVLEVKCPCEKIYMEILQLQAKAPTFQMYAAQVQWQLNCSNSKQGRLFFYLRGHRPISTQITRNDSFIASAEKAALEFWELVQTKTPPPMIQGRDKVVYDVPVANADPAWLAKVDQYKEMAKQYSDMKAKSDAAKAELKKLESYFTSNIPDNAPSFYKDGIRATKVERAGSIDYLKLIKAIEEKFDISIEEDFINSFKSEGSSYYRVTAGEPETEDQKALNASITNIASANTAQQVNVTHLVKEMPKTSPKVDKVALTKGIERNTGNDSHELATPVPANDYFKKSTKNMFF